MDLPRARGAFGADLFTAMRAGDPTLLDPSAKPEHDEDAAIALWALYELHYRGFDDVDARLEWDADLLRARGALEADLETRLRSRYESPDLPDVASTDFATAFFAFVEEHDGASLAAHVQTRADQAQVLELLRLRSVYHLKETDPTAWVVPRLPARAQASLVELMYDEYGTGDPRRLHAQLFADGLAACGLSADYGAYVDEAPLEVLEQNNAMSLFGLHRRLRGAALGHLAAFEASSSLPSRRLVQGLQRLEMPAAMSRYYAEHVEADAVHEQLAVRTMCGSLVEEQPRLLDDVYFGAFSCLDLEDRLARRLLATWGVAA
ncbi:MAG: iron-containing redox enzyme family protein [Actinobacteria bacterium]|uniref:Unannotated protein n=1 Tax=freshwater metagenome TaxID=449393 RepID=A0A6J6NFV0_9ZZZZ|nr:iron-containing redox enzyme family protein [Actinomycetota bacterium]